MVAPVTKRFKFVSPGILINEIDNSFLPREHDKLGPVIIGRTERGPGMRPTQINSQAEFIEAFGNPIPGKGGGDIWREGNTLGPTYASYAAMAYLKNNGPVTMIRLLGTENKDKTAGGEAGWSINDGSGDAYGLFCVNSSSMGQRPSAVIQVTATNDAPEVGSSIKLDFADEADDGARKTVTLTCHASANNSTTFSTANGAAGAKLIEACINTGSYWTGGNVHPFSASLNDRDITIYAPYPENVSGSAGITVNYQSVALRLTASLTGSSEKGVVIADDTLATFFGGTDATIHTGTLAAVWYLNDVNHSVVLKGTQAGTTSTEVSGTGVWCKSVEDDTFQVQIVKESNTVTGSWTVREDVKFSMNSNGKNFIRNMFNTNPTLLNPDITSTTDTRTEYFLGETFESYYHDRVTAKGAGGQLGIILKLSNSTADQAVHQREATAAETGWVIAQDTTTNWANFYPENMQKLFKLVSKHAGQHDSGRYKVSIQDIRASSTPHGSPYGSFTVVVRQTDDDDTTIRIVEQFRNCNLNPASPNYIARKIGDQYETWDDTERRYRVYGSFPSRSDIIYVTMNQDADAGVLDPVLLPFGFLGPARHKRFGLITGAGIWQPGLKNFDDLPGATVRQLGANDTFVQGGENLNGRPPVGTLGLSPVEGSASVWLGAPTNESFATSGDVLAAKIVFPSMLLRTTSEDLQGHGGNGKSAYWGVKTNRSGSNRRDPAWFDVVKNFPSGIDANGAAAGQEYSFTFSLDDIKAVGTAHGAWNPENRRTQLSMTALSGTYEWVLDQGYDKFTMPLWGGDDGLDITEKEPFNNTDLSGKNERDSSAFSTIRRAIDMLADPEVVEFDVATMPGVTNPALTTHLMNTCEARGDALAIIDIENGFLPHTENASGDNSTANRGSIDLAVSSLKTRRLNSSYACCYYPWVRIGDPVQDASLWAPPSVVALGTMGSSATDSELWFAPAGFTRGGLTEGSAGIPVLGVRERLTSKERDKLYDANINPVATFPAEGIVIFGQKTLQVVPSALDRINVRRLMIYVKKEISRMAATTLFEQNVPRTWNRFLSRVQPFLRSVQARLGLMDFKVVLDETTTTPDLIDRNIMYAKIFLKPAKAIEFIAIDFVITDSGASFED